MMRGVPQRQRFIVCVARKTCAQTNLNRLVHLLDIMMVVHPADEPLSGNLDHDLGFLPVGYDCVRLFGMEWTHPPKAV
jgi:hypothetical protein